MASESLDGWVLEDTSIVPSVVSESDQAQLTGQPAQLEVTLAHDTIPLETCELQAVLSLTAPPMSVSRAPLNLVAVLDHSGSMGGDKLRLVIETMCFVLRHLTERDSLSLVAYDTDVKVLAKLTRCNEEGRVRLEKTLRRLKPGGQTNLSGGLLRGLDLHRCREVDSMTPELLGPVQRVRFGNTWRKLAEEGPGDPDTLPPGAKRDNEWTIELRFECAEDAACVQKVVYKLHKSFKDQEVEVSEAPFSLTRTGWGVFRVFADVHLKDGRVEKIEHDLVFGKDETFQTVLLRLHESTQQPTEKVSTDVTTDVTDGVGVVRSTFLFTDGMANVGVTKLEDLCMAAGNALDDLGENRCVLSTFGFGDDHCADLLRGLADVGGGAYCYVESEDKIGEAFGEALGGLLSTTHQNVQLSLQLSPFVTVEPRTSLPMEGPEVGPNGSQIVTFEIGDIFAEECRDILVKFSLPATVEGSCTIGTLQMHGFSVLAKKFEDVCAEIYVDRQSNADCTGPPHQKVEMHTNRYIATKALEAGRKAAKGGNIDSARQFLSKAMEDLAASPLVQQGDPASLGLFTDVKECLTELTDMNAYYSKTSKKMASMEKAHGTQRACGQGFSEVYTNTHQRSMKSAFSSNVY